MFITLAVLLGWFGCSALLFVLVNVFPVTMLRLLLPDDVEVGTDVIPTICYLYLFLSPIAFLMILLTLLGNLIHGLARMVVKMIFHLGVRITKR